MSLKFRCGSCNVQLYVGARKAGRTIGCPKCGAQQSVPLSTPEPELAPTPVSEPPAVVVDESEVLPILEEWDESEPIPVTEHIKPLDGLRPLPRTPRDHTPAKVLFAILPATAFVILSVAWMNDREPRPSPVEVPVPLPKQPTPQIVAQGHPPVVEPPRKEREPQPPVRSSDPPQAKEADPKPLPPPPPQPLPARHPPQPAQMVDLPPQVAPNKQPVAQENKREQKDFLGKKQLLGPEELKRQLEQIPEVSLDSVSGSSLALVNLAKNVQSRGLVYPGPGILVQQRPDLAGLPLRMGRDCLIDKDAATTLRQLSGELRSRKGQTIANWPETARIQLVMRDRWGTAAMVPALSQMLQVEEIAVRRKLIKMLDEIQGPSAGQALANRACTEVEQELRAAAVEALRKRPEGEYAPTLVSALAYPWSPVAWHAAEVIATLDLSSTIPSVILLLDSSPDPQAPLKVQGGISSIRELVRINHLRNCVLCHAPSEDRNDVLRGAVPNPGEALPPPTNYYLKGFSFIRADVTYLRQDFSVIQPVKNHGPWPEQQRFDFLVRSRPLTSAQKDFLTKAAQDRKTTPQKEAMLFVLRELTGKDLGADPHAWLAVLPPELRPTLKRAPVLEPGITKNEQFLAEIPRLTGGLQEQVREALVASLTRGSTAELNQALRSEHLELRKAAVAAAGRKADASVIPALLDLLEKNDGEEATQAVRQALKKLSGQDFGPEPRASSADREKAILGWNTWWNRQLR